MMNTTELLLHVGVSLCLGMLIGAERQWRQRMAGLRTNTLVCVGATLYVSMSMMIGDDVSPTRVAAQVVSGIGFLGAGVIFKDGVSVHGLNTAATLWCSAAVGVLVGAGFMIPAAIGTGAILTANMLLRYIADIINRQPRKNTEIESVYRLELECRGEDENKIRGYLVDAVEGEALTLRRLWSHDTEDGRLANVRAELLTVGRQDRELEHIMRRLSREPGVTAISWENCSHM